MCEVRCERRQINIVKILCTMYVRERDDVIDEAEDWRIAYVSTLTIDDWVLSSIRKRDFVAHPNREDIWDRGIAEHSRIVHLNAVQKARSAR